MIRDPGALCQPCLLRPGTAHGAWILNPTEPVLQNPFRKPLQVETTAAFDQLIPVPAVAHELDGETVVLLEPRFRGWPLLERWLQPRLGPRRAHVRVRLEDRGGYLWRMLDGTRDVAALIEGFRSEFPDDAEAPEQRVRLYLSGLQKHDFIRLLRRPDGPPDP